MQKWGVLWGSHFQPLEFTKGSRRQMYVKRIIHLNLVRSYLAWIDSFVIQLPKANPPHSLNLLSLLPEYL